MKKLHIVYVTHEKYFKNPVEILRRGFTLAEAQQKAIDDGYYVHNVNFPVDYERRALLYAEEIGVIDYKVKSGMMIYYANFPGEHVTVRVQIDLDNMHEYREVMTRYYKKGNYNMYL